VSEFDARAAAALLANNQRIGLDSAAWAGCKCVSSIRIDNKPIFEQTFHAKFMLHLFLPNIVDVR